MNEKEVFEVSVGLGFTYWERFKILFGGTHYVTLKLAVVRRRLQNGLQKREMGIIAARGEVVR